MAAVPKYPILSDRRKAPLQPPIAETTRLSPHAQILKRAKSSFIVNLPCQVFLLCMF